MLKVVHVPCFLPVRKYQLFLTFDKIKMPVTVKHISFDRLKVTHCLSNKIERNGRIRNNGISCYL